FAFINTVVWADGYLLFPLSPVHDEWDRYYSISLNNPQAAPFVLTTTDGLIEGAGSAALSPDGRTLYYATNANDIERRHIWAVPVAGGTPKQLSTGDAAETSPRPLASGKQIAVLYYGVRQPAAVGLL